MSNPKSLKKYSIVVAHPDDEILWASSLLINAENIIICYSSVPNNKKLTIARKKIKDNYPISKVIFLDIAQASQSIIPTDWQSGETTKFGMKYGRSFNEYKNNYFLLIQKLENLLSKVDLVYTHNPWGEYGHPEHIQVNYVVVELAKKIGFDVWVSGYVSKETFLMMEKNKGFLDLNPKILRTNIELYKKLKDLYDYFGCWTYYEYVPPTFDIFYKLNNKITNDNFPNKTLMLNNINIEESTVKKKLYLSFSLWYKFLFLIRLYRNLKKVIFLKLKIR